MSNRTGLYKDRDVEFCIDNIKLLTRLAKLI